MNVAARWILQWLRFSSLCRYAPDNLNKLWGLHCVRRVFSYVLLSYLLGINGCHDSTKALLPQESNAIKLQQIIPLGMGYADSTINVSAFREQSILRLSDNRYVVGYFDESGEVRLDVLDNKGVILRSLNVVPQLERRLLNDGHCAINLGLGPDGSVHLFYGAHDTLPYYLVTNTASLLESVATSLVATQWSRTISYPQFYNVNGQLQLWFRADPASAVHRSIYDPGLGRMGDASEALITPGVVDRAYMNQLAIRGNQISLSWMFRLFSDDDTVRNEGLFLAQSINGAQDWFTPDGNPVVFPETYGSVEPFLALVPEQQPLNQSASAIGPDGLTYITYYAKDAFGVHQIHLAVLDKSGQLVSTQSVSQNTTAFDLFGRGTLILPLSRPQIAISNRFIHVVYRQADAVIVASRAVRGNVWSYMVIPIEGLGGWEPTISREAWEIEKRLLVFVQSVRQGDADTGAPGPPTPVYIYVFSE